MKKRGYNVLNLILLVLCLASLLLFVLSFAQRFEFHLVIGGRGPNGGLNEDQRTGWEIGFGDGYLAVLRRYSLTLWEVELWRPVSILLLLLLLRSGLPKSWHLITKSSLGVCQLCGYDLRATPQRCPECGGIPIRGPLRTGARQVVVASAILIILIIVLMLIIFPM